MNEMLSSSDGEYIIFYLSRKLKMSDLFNSKWSSSIFTVSTYPIYGNWITTAIKIDPLLTFVVTLVISIKGLTLIGASRVT